MIYLGFHISPITEASPLLNGVSYCNPYCCFHLCKHLWGLQMLIHLKVLPACSPLLLPGSKVLLQLLLGFVMPDTTHIVLPLDVGIHTNV